MQQELPITMLIASMACLVRVVSALSKLNAACAIARLAVSEEFVDVPYPK